MGGASKGTGKSDLYDIFGSVGRDPFAEDDGGPPLESGRVVVATAAGQKGADVDGSMTGRIERKGPPPAVVPGGAPRRPAVSVLDDLWKLDLRTLLWERVRGAGGF